MGITNFYKWIKTEYNNCIEKIGDKCYNHLYIDCNYLLHLCYYNSDNLEHLIIKLSAIILDICAKTQPSDSVNLFCDGTAPFAKLILQRERRFNMTNDDSLNFTPGTLFIQELPKKLEHIINIIKMQYNITFNIDTIEPGEAEIKIKQEILKNYNINKNKTHILVTNDADVILIVTSHESYKKCNILLHNDVLSIDKLITTHILKVGGSLFSYLDFSFLNLFMGNDYLPKLNLISVEKLWLYYKTNLALIDNINDRYLIKLDNMQVFINKELMINILNSILANTNRTKLIKYNNIYDEKIYDNYFNGLMWNFQMYHNGICDDYYYMCNTNKPVDIMNLLIHLFSHTISNQIKYNITNKPIPTELCSILLLPESGRYLIDKKFDTFIKKIKKNINIYNKNYKITQNDLFDIVNKFDIFINQK